MRNQPEFNHCYTPDPRHKFHSSLGRRGFTLHPETVAHPGDHSCRFISVMAGDGKTRVYLEFVSAPPKDSRRPGLSFSVRGSLEDYYRRMGPDRFLQPLFYHRNYEWKTKGTKERLPGWNFLKFKRHYPTLYVWFSEYEKWPGVTKARREKGRREVRALVRHANTCHRLVGLEFEVNARGRKYFERALLRKVDGALTLPCGTRLALHPAKRNAFRAAVLEARDFARFCKRAKPDAYTVRDGRRAAVLKNPAGFWDIIVR